MMMAASFGGSRFPDDSDLTEAEFGDGTANLRLTVEMDAVLIAVVPNDAPDAAWVRLDRRRARILWMKLGKFLGEIE
jgi:hypothetical protein